MPDVADRRPALPALTGLRMLAAFAVFLSHFGAPHSSPSWLKAFFESGYMGVTLFFTLSGFVMALNYFDTLSSPTPRKVWSFVAARFARLYPLYALMLGYVLISDHARGVTLVDWWQSALAIQTWNSHLGIAYEFDGPSWSVGVEFFFYACFPILVLLMGRLRSRRSIIVMAAIILTAMFGLTAWFVATGHSSLPWADGDSAHRWLYRTPLTRLGDFTLGILAARLYLLVRHDQRFTRTGGSLVITGSLLIVCLMAWPANVFSAWSWDAAYAAPAVAVIFGLAVAPQGLFARLLSVPVMVLLGEASFAFYMVHVPAIKLLDVHPWVDGTSATTLAFGALTFGAILCLAVGLHTMVERPARVYLRRVLRVGGQHLGADRASSQASF